MKKAFRKKYQSLIDLMLLIKVSWMLMPLEMHVVSKKPLAKRELALDEATQF